MNLELKMEIGWRSLFLAVALVLLATAIGALPEQAGVRQRERAGPRSAQPYRALAAGALLVQRSFQSRQQPGGAVRAASLAAGLALFWVVGGAAVRNRFSGRDSQTGTGLAAGATSFARLLALRALACSAASAALLFGLSGVFAAAQARRPLELSLPLVAVFSALVYSCWKALSLFLAVVEQARDWRSGWHIFARRWPHLVASSASYSTLKWSALVAIAAPLSLGWWRYPAWWWGAGLLLLPVITGYCAVRWRATVARLIHE